MRSFCVSLLTCLVATCTVIAQEKQPDSKTTAADEKAIAVLIRQLGDESFDKREAAAKALAVVGSAALPLLRKAAKEATDLEARERAGKLVRTITTGPGPGVLYTGGSVREITVSRDGQTLAVACEDKIVYVYDLKTGALRHSLKSPDAGPWSVAISPDGRTLAAGCAEYGRAEVPGEIILWDLAKGTQTRTLKGHPGGSFGLAFSNDGKVLYSCGWDETIRLWEPVSGKEMSALQGHKGPVRRIHSTPDGKFIVSCGFDSTVRFWNRETLKEERQFVARHDGIAVSALSPDGKWFITGSRNSRPPEPGAITVWDVATGKEKASITGPTSKVTSLAVSPDNKLLAMGGGQTREFGEVKIFDLMTGKELAHFRDHADWVPGIAFSPDGRWLVSGSGSGSPGGTRAEVRYWDMVGLRAKGE